MALLYIVAGQPITTNDGEVLTRPFLPVPVALRQTDGW